VEFREMAHPLYSCRFDDFDRAKWAQLGGRFRSPCSPFCGLGGPIMRSNRPDVSQGLSAEDASEEFARRMMIRALAGVSPVLTRLRARRRPRPGIRCKAPSRDLGKRCIGRRQGRSPNPPVSASSRRASCDGYQSDCRKVPTFVGLAIRLCKKCCGRKGACRNFRRRWIGGKWPRLAV
jgi:hypothetical protein